MTGGLGGKPSPRPWRGTCYIPIVVGLDAVDVLAVHLGCTGHPGEAEDVALLGDGYDCHWGTASPPRYLNLAT